MGGPCPTPPLSGPPLERIPTPPSLEVASRQRRGWKLIGWKVVRHRVDQISPPPGSCPTAGLGPGLFKASPSPWAVRAMALTVTGGCCVSPAAPHQAMSSAGQGLLCLQGRAQRRCQEERLDQLLRSQLAVGIQRTGLCVRAMTSRKGQGGVQMRVCTGVTAGLPIQGGRVPSRATPRGAEAWWWELGWRERTEMYRRQKWTDCH